MIKCISIDGIDGAGKTTVVTALSAYYNVITLPRFYFSGMVPIDSLERKNWFRTEDVIKTTDIYITGQKMRYLLAKEFKKGMHYKITEHSKKTSLIVIDRGEPSLKAFSFAAIKKGTLWEVKRIDEYLSTRFNDLFEKEIEGIIDRSFLLFEKGTFEEICKRRFLQDDDLLLAKYQQEYYETHEINVNTITTISPLNKKDDIMRTILNSLKLLGA